ncbi:MAG: DUF1828 domain-containing protein [Acidobacteria bacterium]|nr:DUF1828 domain-containing protein [Acidobacteriota bacterium]
MTPLSIKEDFKNRVSEQLDLEQERDDRFRVLTPFRFEDGDHYQIVLKREGDRWILTDEGSTFMHLSYWLDEKDINSGTRREIIDTSLAIYSVEDRDGELIVPVYNERFGDALFNFVQALAKVTDVSFLSRELVRSTFLEDFRNLLRANVPEDRLEFDWINPEHDPTGKYPVDARVNHMPKPLLVFALPKSEDKINIATITLLMFERWGVPFQSLSIFEDQADVPRKTLARFTDVSGKAFSSLKGNEERISAYVGRALAGN